MYEQFYGLRERPFEVTSNPRYLLLTPRHREALGNLEYGIATRSGVVVLTGDAGTGKTTLLNAAINTAKAGLPEAMEPRIAYVSNPRFAPSEFIEYMASQFRLSAAAGRSKARFLIELESTLIEDLHANRPAALIIDEVQSMSHDLLEEVRLLANLEKDSRKLLPVLLVGQTEFDERLNDRALRQLKQRITLRCRLSPLTVHETAAYIATRVSRAGGNPAAIFSREAVLTVYARSKGIPRSISVLCDNAMLTGFAASRSQIGADVIAEVGADFDLWPARGRTQPLAAAGAAPAQGRWSSGGARAASSR